MLFSITPGHLLNMTTQTREHNRKSMGNPLDFGIFWIFRIFWILEVFTPFPGLGTYLEMLLESVPSRIRS